LGNDEREIRISERKIGDHSACPAGNDDG
jgi:hypothetical protein